MQQPPSGPRAVDAPAESETPNQFAPWEWSAFSDFTWEAGATLIAATFAVIGVLMGLAITNAQNQRERRARDYAEAIGAVSAYLEGPYRVARCGNSPDERFAIATDISTIQARIDASSALLRLHAPRAVADAYDHYVQTARREAGVQMADEWRKRPSKRRSDMNRRRPFDRKSSTLAKNALVNAMQRDLAQWRWWKVWRWF